MNFITKRILLFSFVLVFLGDILCQNPGYLWGRHVTTYLTEVKSATDKQGNLIICLRGYDSTVVGEQLLAGNAYNIFLLKYSPTGTVIWAKTIASSRGMVHASIDLGPDNNIYIAGSWNNDKSVKIGSTTFTSNSGSGSYLCATDSSGSILWSKSISDTQSNALSYVAVSDSNRITVAGWYHQGPFQVEMFTLPTSTCNNTFFADYDKNGNLMWVKYDSPLKNNYPISMTLDRDGNILMNLLYTSSCSMTSPVASLSKFDHFGNIIWSKPTVIGYSGSMMCDRQNNIYTTSQDTIHKLDKFGNRIWSVPFKIPNALPHVGLNISDLDVDSVGNVFTTGTYYSSQLSVGNLVLPNSTSTQTFNPIPTMFISKISQIGNPEWLKGINNGCESFGLQISVDHLSNVYVSGQSICSPISFGQDTLKSINSVEFIGFVARLINESFVNLSEIDSERLFAVYPNPSDGKISILSEFTEMIFSINVLDGAGISISNYHNTSAMTTLTIDLSDFDPGVYFLQIRSEKGFYVKKVILH